MKKRKTYEISVIDKTYSKTISDETKFYTSDTALELGFELKETEYTFESAEIVLLNIDDRSLVTRPVAKNLDSFTYELDDDIIAHYGEWRGQLRFEQTGETYVSSPVKFRIENDLSNDRPPQLSDVQSWVSLKRYADSLIEELKQAVLSVEGIEDAFNTNETIRQTTFETNESERNETFNTNEDIRQTQESEREGAETARQIVFDGNEASRNETFNNNEALRQENETTRQQAEGERQSAERVRVENDSNREVEITKMQNDVLHYGAVKLVNIIKNGDFSKGIEGWRGINSDLQLSTFNELSLTTISNPKSSYPKANYIIDSEMTTGHVYYSGFYLHDFELSTTGAVFMQTGIGNYSNKLVSNTRIDKAPNTYLSSVQIINSGFASISISGDGVIPNSSEFITFSKVYLIDLTKAFGEGNEPSKEVMDWIIKENGYFEELTLRRDDIQQYEINQLRKAVIALGGTI